MKKVLFALSGLALALAMACSSPTAEPTTQTTIPTTAPTATTVPQAETPTPRPPQEWRLEGIVVAGSTVTVSLFFHSTASVGVTLDGAPQTRRDNKPPVTGFVFEDVDPGEHAIEIKDVMGNVERATVVVEAFDPDGGNVPDWLAKWVADLEAGKVEFPPQSITKYQYQGQTVYHVVKQCCDQFSDLLDAEGNLIGHPDGGITGRGDGETQFSPSNLKGEEIWQGR